MMETRIYWFLLSFLILASCKGVTDTSQEAGTEIDCSKIAHGEFYLSDIAQDFSLLSLETTEESLIGQIEKIEFFKDEIFILDTEHSACVLVFDRWNGKFKRKIGRRGEAPNEYNFVYDFTIDTQNQLLYVLCDRRCCNIYNLFGEFKEKAALEFAAVNISYAGNNKFCLVGDERDGYNLLVTDEQLKIRQKKFPNQEYGANLLRLVQPLVGNVSSSVYYMKFADDHLYTVDKDGQITAGYWVDFGDDRMNFDNLAEMSSKQLKDKKKRGRGYIKYVTDSKRYLSLLFFDKDTPCMAFHDKKEGATHSYYYDKMKDDLTGLPFSLLEYSTERNEVVAIVSHTSVLGCANLTDKAKEVLKGIELCEDDNPFLYFVKLCE